MPEEMAHSHGPAVITPNKQKRPALLRGVWHFCEAFGAENETRTRDPDLGKVVLYQLSYFRSMSKTVFR